MLVDSPIANLTKTIFTSHLRYCQVYRSPQRPEALVLLYTDENKVRVIRITVLRTDEDHGANALPVAVTPQGFLFVYVRRLANEYCCLCL